MNLLLTLTLTLLYCVLTPFIMVGIDHDFLPSIVEGHLHDELIWMHIPSGINVQLAINVLGSFVEPFIGIILLKLS